MSKWKIPDDKSDILNNAIQLYYVGQSGRQLKIKLIEHRNHIHRNTSTHSVITDHRLQHNHEFDWNNVVILDSECNYKKRLMSEMIYIKRQKNGLNLHTDTEFLDKTYMPFLNNI